MVISIGLRKQIPMRGEEINAVGDVELELDNQSGLMEMSGYATVGNGYLNLFGKRWDIHQARIDFIRGEDPRVGVELTHDFETAMVRIRVIGSPEHPELIVTSDPPIYDEAQLLLFVLGSGPNEDPKQTSIGQQAAGVAANALLGEVQSKLEDELPIDMLELDVGDGAKLSRLRLGRWLTSRVFLGYDYDFEAEDDENVSEALLQYRLGKGWMLESRYGDRGNGGLDAFWVKRF
jgi:translocation and assembly module TamB